MLDHGRELAGYRSLQFWLLGLLTQTLQPCQLPVQDLATKPKTMPIAREKQLIGATLSAGLLTSNKRPDHGSLVLGHLGHRLEIRRHWHAARVTPCWHPRKLLQMRTNLSYKVTGLPMYHSTRDTELVEMCTDGLR